MGPGRGCGAGLWGREGAPPATPCPSSPGCARGRFPKPPAARLPHPIAPGAPSRVCDPRAEQKWGDPTPNGVIPHLNGVILHLNRAIPYPNGVIPQPWGRACPAPSPTATVAFWGQPRPAWGRICGVCAVGAVGMPPNLPGLSTGCPGAGARALPSPAPVAPQEAAGAPCRARGSLWGEKGLRSCWWQWGLPELPQRTERPCAERGRGWGHGWGRVAPGTPGHCGAGADGAPERDARGPWGSKVQPLIPFGVGFWGGFIPSRMSWGSAGAAVPPSGSPLPAATVPGGALAVSLSLSLHPELAVPVGPGLCGAFTAPGGLRGPFP